MSRLKNYKSKLKRLSAKRLSRFFRGYGKKFCRKQVHVFFIKNKLHTFFLKETFALQDKIFFFFKKFNVNFSLDFFFYSNFKHRVVYWKYFSKFRKFYPPVFNSFSTKNLNIICFPLKFSFFFEYFLNNLWQNFYLLNSSSSLESFLTNIFDKTNLIKQGVLKNQQPLRGSDDRSYILKEKSLISSRNFLCLSGFFLSKQGFFKFFKKLEYLNLYKAFKLNNFNLVKFLISFFGKIYFGFFRFFVHFFKYFLYKCLLCINYLKNPEKKI